MKVAFGHTNIDIAKGDAITQRSFHCIAISCNSAFEPNSTFSSDVHKLAGAKLQDECHRLTPLSAGNVFLTQGFDLKESRIIHCNVIPFDAPSSISAFRKTLTEILSVADQEGLKSLALPPLGYRNLGFPLMEIAFSTFSTIIDQYDKLKTLKEITAIVENEMLFGIFQSMLTKLYQMKHNGTPIPRV